jgi:long-chain acyl-CoA synthetase
MTLVEILQRTTAAHPHNQAIVHKSRGLSYESLYRAASQLSFELIQRGVKPGDRVVLLLENSPSYLISYFGILGSGAVVVALNPDTTAHELKHLLSDSEPKGIICHASVLPVLEPVIETLPFLKFILLDGCPPPERKNTKTTIGLLNEAFQGGELRDFIIGSEADLAQIIYTSGTTGRPKGVMLTHRNLRANTEAIVAYLKLTEHDRVMVILPFFYSYGNSLLRSHAFVGGTLVVAEQFVFFNMVV